MLKKLNIGNDVDDSTGDYLREGGLKINSNFEELYYQLGDGSFPHAAGAWKTHSVQKDGNTLTADFGKAYAIDTSVAQMSITMPKGTTADYNKVIRFRDVFGTWQTNPVTISPANGDTLKGDPESKVFSTNLTDLEMVYCSPGRWEYIGSKQLNKISNGDQTTIITKEYIAEEGQTDFLDVFGGELYNLANTQVFRRGNLLYHGKVFSDNSDYGSVGAGGTLVEMDGSSIKLREPCEAGDAVIIITYLDSLASWRSTYNRLDVTILDQTKTIEKSVIGSKIVADLETLNTITVEEMGYVITSNTGLINPMTFEVYVNGVFLNEAGTGGLPLFKCEGIDTNNQFDCISSGGVWGSSNIDYSLITNTNTNAITSIVFGRKFEDGDIISIKWFNNDIGTTLSIDEITNVTDQKYVTNTKLNLSGTIRVTDYDKPAWPNVEENGNTVLNVTSPFSIFDCIYPIGTIYENGVNPNNPVSYMGFGVWQLFGEKQTTIGWTKDNQDTLFHYNNNDIDSGGSASATAGGTGGSRNVTLTNNHLPKTQTDEKVLVADSNGAIVVGGCQFDPDEQGPAYNKYREENAVTNATHIPPTSIDILPPYITVYRWMRIA